MSKPKLQQEAYKVGAMADLLKQIHEIEYRALKATKGPWVFTANYPFYVDVTKPAPSLSKHDLQRPTYWRYQDGEFVSTAREDVLLLVKSLREALALPQAPCKAELPHGQGIEANEFFMPDDFISGINMDTCIFEQAAKVANAKLRATLGAVNANEALTAYKNHKWPIDSTITNSDMFIEGAKWQHE
jgi:hypothetical protein